MNDIKVETRLTNKIILYDKFNVNLANDICITDAYHILGNVYDNFRAVLRIYSVKLLIISCEYLRN